MDNSPALITLDTSIKLILSIQYLHHLNNKLPLIISSHLNDSMHRCLAILILDIRTTTIFE